MKWRWSNVERTHGYCGAAGPQPEFPAAEPAGNLNAYTLEAHARALIEVDAEDAGTEGR